MKTEFQIGIGVVLGDYWGGGKGWYASDYRGKVFKTLGELKSFIDKELQTGGLDSGMGYEKLIGYAIWATKIQTIEQHGQLFTNESSELLTSKGLDSISEWDIDSALAAIHG